jgi:N4-gp56 family major capsid protein
MAGVLSTTTEIPSGHTEYYDRVLLTRGIDENLHDMFGQPRPMKTGFGTTIKFRRYNSLGTNPEAYRLDQGVTPDGEKMTKTDVTATLVQFGNFVTVTDVVTWTNPDAALTEAAMILGEQMGEVRDKYIRDIINAGTGVSYEDGTTTAAGRSTVDNRPILGATGAQGIKLIVQTMHTGNAKVMKQVLKASVGINTYPIAPSFCAIAHNLNANDIRGFTGFVEPHEYGTGGPSLKQEFGAVWDVRFAWSNNAKVFAGAGAASVDVYSILFFGREAYGITALEKGTVKNIIKPLGSGGTADPLDQRATSGWKGFWTAAVLNNDFMHRYEVALADA